MRETRVTDILQTKSQMAGHWHGFWTFLLLIAAANFGKNITTARNQCPKILAIREVREGWSVLLFPVEGHCMGECGGSIATEVEVGAEAAAAAEAQ
jgi:hypothetical protein